MSRIAPKLLTALLVLGCGSGAMASPNRGQWTDNAGGDQNQPAQGPYQGTYPSQSAPSPVGYPQGGYQPPGGYSQGSAAQGNSSQGFPGAQGGYQDQGPVPPPDQEQDEDFAETEPVEGQARLGVMVLSLTPELRRYFGVASDRGVLIARVEPNSAAARAGIQVGDVLVRVGPQVVHAGDDVVQALAVRQGVTGRLRVAVVRQGRPVHMVAFISTPNNNNQPPMNQGFQGPPGQVPQGPQGPQGPMNSAPINQGPPVNPNNGTFNQSNLPNSSSQQNQL